MLDTRFSRKVLQNLLVECVKCAEEFYDNAALIMDDNGDLTDEQVEAVMVHLHEKHVYHVH